MDPVVGQIALGVYALLLAVGGVMGFVKARSQASLKAGLLSAIIASVCAGWSIRDPGTGFGLGIVLALVLLSLFAPRFAKSRKFMPAGLLCVASLVVAALLALLLIRPAA